MAMFNGILNDNGNEKSIRMVVDLNLSISYLTDSYIDEIYVDTQIQPSIIAIDDKKYNYCVKKCGGEIIIAGKETAGLLHYLLPCIFKPIFFVLTNKEQV